MLEVVEDGLCSLEVLEVLEEMRCILGAVEGGICSLEVP